MLRCLTPEQNTISLYSAYHHENGRLVCEWIIPHAIAVQPARMLKTAGDPVRSSAAFPFSSSEIGRILTVKACSQLPCYCPSANSRQVPHIMSLSRLFTRLPVSVAKVRKKSEITKQITKKMLFVWEVDSGLRPSLHPSQFHLMSQNAISFRNLIRAARRPGRIHPESPGRSLGATRASLPARM